MLNITNEEDLLLAVEQSHLKKRATMGGIGSVVSKGEHKRTLRVVVRKVVHIYEPEERCQDGALWKSFREGALPTRSSSSLSSWFTSSCAYHLITVTTFALNTYHSLDLSLQT